MADGVILLDKIGADIRWCEWFPLNKSGNDYFPSFCSKERLSSGLGLGKVWGYENFTINDFSQTDRQNLRTSVMKLKSRISDDNYI